MAVVQLDYEILSSGSLFWSTKSKYLQVDGRIQHAVTHFIRIRQQSGTYFLPLPFEEVVEVTVSLDLGLVIEVIVLSPDFFLRVLRITEPLQIVKSALEEGWNKGSPRCRPYVITVKAQAGGTHTLWRDRREGGTHNSRGHTKAWESTPQLEGHTEACESTYPTQRATPKHGSPYPRLEGPH